MTVAGEVVSVRWLAVDDIAPAQWPRLEALLEESECRRADRFAFQRDRETYVAAHALGRWLLSSWQPQPPPSWRFVVGEHGKPEVAMPPGAPRLRLNLSHTRGLAAAVLTRDHDVGVDVEWLDRRAPTLDLADRFFAAAECAHLRTVPAPDFAATFLAFWTLKEAYVKAIGKGLAQPLDSFAFTLSPPAIRFDGGGDDPARWWFHRAQPTPSHVLAVALRHPAPATVAVDARAVHPDEML